MGCDIHVQAFTKKGSKYLELSEDFFDVRSYRLFGFLAGRLMCRHLSKTEKKF